MEFQVEIPQGGLDLPDNCVAIFDKKVLNIYKSTDVIITPRSSPMLGNLEDGLYDIPFHQFSST